MKKIMCMKNQSFKQKISLFILFGLLYAQNSVFAHIIDHGCYTHEHSAEHCTYIFYYDNYNHYIDFNYPLVFFNQTNLNTSFEDNLAYVVLVLLIPNQRSPPV